MNFITDNESKRITSNIYFNNLKALFYLEYNSKVSLICFYRLSDIVI